MRDRGRHRRWVGPALVGLLIECVAIWRRGYRLGGTHVVVRCSERHLFTTIWIAGVSLKSLRLGPWRVQRCPVGGHFSIVTPVPMRELSAQQRELAAEHRDIRIP